MGLPVQLHILLWHLDPDPRTTFQHLQLLQFLDQLMGRNSVVRWKAPKQNSRKQRGKTISRATYGVAFKSLLRDLRDLSLRVWQIFPSFDKRSLRVNSRLSRFYQLADRQWLADPVLDEDDLVAVAGRAFKACATRTLIINQLLNSPIIAAVISIVDNTSSPVVAMSGVRAPLVMTECRAFSTASASSSSSRL